MTRPYVRFTDAERAVADLLAAELPARGVTAPVVVEVPDTWTPQVGDLLQVAHDGTPGGEGVWPMAEPSTMRLTAWSDSPTRAKDLAGTAHAHLLAHAGTADVAGFTYLTGLLVTRDPDTNARLASVTVRAILTPTQA